jgi:uncharacterized membrane protein YeaQ/YmgE (transglycosylase-associated protein family)
MIGLLLWLLVIGIIAGFLARLIVPGRDPMTFWQTVLLGVVGSFVGGLIGHALFDSGSGWIHPSGVIGSIIGAVILLLVFRAATHRRGGVWGRRTFGYRRRHLI